jgi:hypothetical protein
VANPSANQAHSHISWGDWGTGTTDEIDFNPGDNATAVFSGEAIGSGTVSFAGSNGSTVIIKGLAVAHANGIRGTTDDCGVFAVAEGS